MIPDDFVPISAEENVNIQLLKEKIYQRLDLIRIYLQRRLGETDFDKPLILPAGSDIGNVCDRIHRDLRKNFKYALVIGRSVKFKNQRVGFRHVVQDEDIVAVME